MDTKECTCSCFRTFQPTQYGIEDEDKRYNIIEKAIENMVRFPTFKIPIKENSKIYKKLYRIFLPTLLEVHSKKRVTKDL